ncbi:MAG: cysteine desulfurase-like protein [Armatimonadetes bacterium]|nr:cysteine desulfurase-like protein [Armatimonadota bacterium]
MIQPSDVRAQFAALDGSFAYLENAGGSQVPNCVIDEITRFFREDYVQLGSGYAASDRAGELVYQAHGFINEFFNGVDVGSVAVGQSSTALTHMLANSLRFGLKPGDEIVISVSNHESNIAPWMRLEHEGVVIRWWGVDSETGMVNIDDLNSLLNEKTKLVAFTQTCNMMGDDVDVAAVTKLAHESGAKAIVDSVAAASHIAPDVKAWDVDFCFYSQYKVYGPHFGCLWGKDTAWSEMNAPGHFFLPDEGTKRFELGCTPYELLAGVLKLQDYFAFLAGHELYQGRATIEAAYAAMAKLEEPLIERIEAMLDELPGIRRFGPATGAHRHPTFSFTHESLKPSEIVRAVHQHPIGIKHGHMYAYRWCEAVGIEPEEGAVRVSAVHYNTVDEIDQLEKVLRLIVK